jgi:aminoglycoside 6'-N-acetyltransferase I
MNDVRALAARDVDAWAIMRSELWPDADATELAQEARTFAGGAVVPAIDAVFVAVDGQDLAIGFLELSVRPFADGCDTQPVAHVEGWYVEGLARHRGIGRSLVRAAEDWARARGLRELASDTEIHNDASQRAHAACGFEEVERLVKFRKRLGVA